MCVGGGGGGGIGTILFTRTGKCFNCSTRLLALVGGGGGGGGLVFFCSAVL